LKAEIATTNLDERSLDQILTPEAVEFLTELHGRFDARRRVLLEARIERRAALAGGGTLDFLEETREIREADWRVPPPRPDYEDRRVEITGPTDRKLVINALNSGARGFMADFEDANSPTWANQVSGHTNLIDAVERTISYESSDGREYRLHDETATLIVRPRGWHMDEKHMLIGDRALAGAFLDFGLFAFHCGRRLLNAGSAPYLYLPKMEHHEEARLWNEVFDFTEAALSLKIGSIRPTVLIETLPAAFQMDEIIYQLRDRSYGLNAGRWDYIFSTVKTFRERSEFVLPDRTDVKMASPFMASYASLLVKTCHARGAFAMGGMAALIPSRTDAAANERAIAAVKEDKEREASLGFDGTWVAHPDVVGVARDAFGAVLGEKPNQIDNPGPEGPVTASDLLDVGATPGSITEAGLRLNVNVGFQYISFWLGGRGAAGINNLMEDAATAEISRSQIWQWIEHGAELEDGAVVTRDLVRQILDEEMEKIHAEVGDETWAEGAPETTREVFERVTLADDYADFLTTVAYERLD
jgi:malate synthase